MNSRSDIMHVEKVKYMRPKQRIATLDILQSTGQRYFLRQTAQQTSLVIDGVELIYPSKSNQFSTSAIFLFRSVKQDALKFLQKNPDWTAIDKLPTNTYNYDYDDQVGSLTGTDINHAYWSIARNLGIITEKTFLSGLREKFKIYYEDVLIYTANTQNEANETLVNLSGLPLDEAINDGWKIDVEQFKATRLAALAVLGRRKVYKEFVGTNEVREVIVTEGDERLRDCYKAIRYTCYQYMTEMAELLGDNFESYQTDCIFYRDSDENRRKVHEYLKSKGMRFKQLVYS